MSPASVCQGIAILSEIFETGNGSSVAIENIGLIALTRVGSRSMVQISAGFMLFFSVLGEIWSSLCLHSNAYRGCVVLPLLCLCWGSVGLVLAECSLGRPMLIHHALDEQHLGRISRSQKQPKIQSFMLKSSEDTNVRSIEWDK